jgi:hypothetical protein
MKNMILNQENGNDKTKKLEHNTYLHQNLKMVEQTCWESIHEIVCQKDFSQLDGHFLIIKQISKQISQLEKNLHLLSAKTR